VRVELADVVVGAVREMTIGACMGLAVATMMSGVEIGGLMIGQQAGIALGQVFNPVQDRETSIVGQIYSLVLILVFLSVGGHRALVGALLDSFEVVPLWSTSNGDPPVVLIAEMLASSLILAVRLAGPVLVAVFMASIAMGFLSRTMPQLNILSVGFQARIMIGMGAAAIALLGARELLLSAIFDGIAMVRDHYGLEAASRLAGA
jgi:flagellar biosynthetic protein FliR